MKKLFLHGLDSSGSGTKGSFFKEHFPDLLAPDFSGSLELRLQVLKKLCPGDEPLILIGSSFGGLMATTFSIEYPRRVHKLFLLAPALNFPGFLLPDEKVTAPAYLLIGKNDVVTPPERVLPIAKQTFANLTINVVDEDHLLHTSFRQLNWRKMLADER